MPTVNGQYSLPSGYRATPGQTIKSSQHNPPLEDLAVAMTARMTRDGSAGMTGALPMGGNKITGLGAAESSGDAPRFDQVTPYDPYLSAVAALEKVADRIPYATGENTAALAVLTAAARTFLAAADAAAQRGAMGLGTIATENTASRVLDQSTWDTGAGTTDAFISPAKLLAFIRGRRVESSPLSMTDGSNVFFAHGFDAPPARVKLRLVCQSSDLGYSAGDFYDMGEGYVDPGSGTDGLSVKPTATNVVVGVGPSGIAIMNKTPSAGSGTIDTSKWRLKIFAYID